MIIKASEGMAFACPSGQDGDKQGVPLSPGWNVRGRNPELDNAGCPSALCPSSFHAAFLPSMQTETGPRELPRPGAQVKHTGRTGRPGRELEQWVTKPLCPAPFPRGPAHLLGHKDKGAGHCF